MKENLVIKGRNKDKNENCFLVYGVEIAKAASQIADLKIDSVKGKVFWKIETEQRMGISHGIKRDTSLARLQPFEGRRLA